MGRPRLSAPTLLHPAAVESSAAKILSKIFDRLDAGEAGPRILPFVRVSELCPPLSRGYVFKLLKERKLRAERYNGLVHGVAWRVLRDHALWQNLQASSKLTFTTG